MRNKDFSHWRGVIIAYAALLLLIFLSSCKTTRKVSEDYNLKDSLNVVYGSLSNTKISDNSFSWLLDSLRSRTVFDIKIYDTSQEKDSLGYYPLLAEVHGESESTNIRTSVEQKDVEIEESSADSLLIQAGREEEYHRKEERKTTGSLWSGVVSMFTIICSFLLLAFCLKILIKKVL